MLFLAFFRLALSQRCLLQKQKQTENCAGRGQLGQGLEVVVGHGKWVLRGFWLMATVTLEG